MCVTIQNSVHGVLLLPSLKKQRELIQGPIKNFLEIEHQDVRCVGYAPGQIWSRGLKSFMITLWHTYENFAYTVRPSIVLAFLFIFVRGGVLHLIFNLMIVFVSIRMKVKITLQFTFSKINNNVNVM